MDLASGSVRRIHSSSDVPSVAALQLDGTRLFGVAASKDGDGAARLVELDLNKTLTAITGVHVLDTAAAVAVSGRTVYCLATPGVIKAIRR